MTKREKSPDLYARSTSHAPTSAGKQKSEASTNDSNRDDLFHRLLCFQDGLCGKRLNQKPAPNEGMYQSTSLSAEMDTSLIDEQNAFRPRAAP